MRIKIGRWGENLALPIPKSLAEKIHFKPDMEIELILEGKTLGLGLIRTPIMTVSYLNCRHQPKAAQSRALTAAAARNLI